LYHRKLDTLSMATLTVKQVRRILGKDAQGVSDADLERDIDVVMFLKNIFFDYYRKVRTNPSNTIPKVP
jgi:hypothetical protein